MSPTRTRQALAAAILALAAVFASTTAATGATEPHVDIELTMRGCSGQATLVVEGVRGTGVNGVVTEAVSWSAGETITTDNFIGAIPTIRLERDGRVLFAAVVEVTTWASLLEATLDCSTVPYTVLSIDGGTVVEVPDAAMSRPALSFAAQIGLILLGMSCVAGFARVVRRRQRIG